MITFLGQEMLSCHVSCIMFPLFALALKAFISFVMALAAAHAWCEHHQKLLGVRRLGGPEGFTMGDANVRRPVATRFQHGVWDAVF